MRATITAMLAAIPITGLAVLAWAGLTVLGPPLLAANGWDHHEDRPINWHWPVLWLVLTLLAAGLVYVLVFHGPYNEVSSGQSCPDPSVSSVSALRVALALAIVPLGLAAARTSGRAARQPRELLAVAGVVVLCYVAFLTVAFSFLDVALCGG